MIKCIIFDCDGTLVDSEMLFNQALSNKLAERGIDISAARLVERFRGVKFMDVLRTLEQENGLSLGNAFVDSYRELVRDLFEQELVACDGVAETLVQLKTAMCVATNGPLAKMQQALRVTGLAHHFNENLFSAYEIGAWKPNPALFLHASKTMGFKANECLVVEDSLVGIEAALSANMKAVLFDPHGIHSDMDGVTRVSKFNEIMSHL